MPSESSCPRAVASRSRGRGHGSAGQHDRDGQPRAEVPGAAHESARRALADIHPGRWSFGRRWDACRLEHFAYHETARSFASCRAPRAAMRSTLGKLVTRAAVELLQRQVDLDVLGEPGLGDFPLNLPLRTRRSFSQNARRSGIPWPEHAIRSMAEADGEARPSSGSRSNVPEDIGSTQPAPPGLDPARFLHVAHRAPQ